MEGDDPLARRPPVAVLLRALRLPEEEFPFAGVTALLRHGYFRPDWPEQAGRPDLPLLAEALLRLLGEPRGREAYLAAVRRWAEAEQPGLEDEAAEESRRRRTHELAVQCRPFLERQAELVAPDLVLLLGGAAAKHIFDVADGIMRVRGKWRDLTLGERKVRAIATLHPAYLLRTPAAKRLVWRDLLAVKAALQA